MASPKLDEEDGEETRGRKQLERIRTSRQDAVKRYNTRLEYLRTKLKSAEIYERLLKK